MSGWGVTKKTRNFTELPEVVDANIGVCADDRLLIFETDNLDRAVELLKNEGATIPETFTVESRPGRRHFYFLQTPGTRESKNLSLPGLFELRCRDQYVVGAGSIHPKTGMPYQIVQDVQIVPFPADLLKALQHLKGESSLKRFRA